VKVLEIKVIPEYWKTKSIKYRVKNVKKELKYRIKIEYTFEQSKGETLTIRITIKNDKYVTQYLDIVRRAVKKHLFSSDNIYKDLISTYYDLLAEIDRDVVSTRIECFDDYFGPVHAKCVIIGR